MATHNEKGRVGESMACDYLREKGYAILETNWRYGKLEADIIAYGDDIIVFVEVKTRSNNTFGEPETFVDKAKQRAYVRLANHYITENKRTEEARFDIIAITTDGTTTTLNHFPNAFTVIDALSKTTHINV